MKKMQNNEWSYMKTLQTMHVERKWPALCRMLQNSQGICTENTLSILEVGESAALIAQIGNPSETILHKCTNHLEQWKLRFMQKWKWLKLALYVVEKLRGEIFHRYCTAYTLILALNDSCLQLSAYLGQITFFWPIFWTPLKYRLRIARATSCPE